MRRSVTRTSLRRTTCRTGQSASRTGFVRQGGSGSAASIRAAPRGLPTVSGQAGRPLARELFGQTSGVRAGGRGGMSDGVLGAAARRTSWGSILDKACEGAAAPLPVRSRSACEFLARVGMCPRPSGDQTVRCCISSPASRRPSYGRAAPLCSAARPRGVRGCRAASAHRISTDDRCAGFGEVAMLICHGVRTLTRSR